MDIQSNTAVIDTNIKHGYRKEINYDSFETKSLMPLILGLIVLHVLLFILLSTLVFSILFAIEIITVSIHLYLGFRITSQDYQDNC